MFTTTRTPLRLIDYVVGCHFKKNTNKVMAVFQVYVSTLVARFFWKSRINMLITSELFVVISLNNSNGFFLVLQKKKKNNNDRNGST